MLDTRNDFEHLPILRELREDLETAFAVRSAPASRRRLRRIRVAAVAVAVAAAGVAIVAALPSDSLLDDAAATAARQRSTIPPSGGTTRFSERGARGSIDVWHVARDGSGRVHERMVIGNRFERPADDAGLPRWRRAGRGWVRDVVFGPGEFPRVYRVVSSTVLDLDPATLPTEPAALEAALREALRLAAADPDPETGFAGPAADWQVLIVIAQTLVHPLASPELRSGLYEVAGGLDGVEVIEDAVAPDDRPAALIRLVRQTHPGTVRHEVYFDPATTNILATSWVVEGGGASHSDTRLYSPPTLNP